MLLQKNVSDLLVSNSQPASCPQCVRGKSASLLQLLAFSKVLAGKFCCSLQPGRCLGSRKTWIRRTVKENESKRKAGNGIVRFYLRHCGEEKLHFRKTQRFHIIYIYRNNFIDLICPCKISSKVQNNITLNKKLQLSKVQLVFSLMETQIYVITILSPPDG